MYTMLRLASTDTNVYYAHVRDAAADLQPPRRHEQRVSSKKTYALYCNANLRLASTDTGVYYVLDAGALLRPLRRHEQNVSSKKIYALYCNANLRLASTDSNAVSYTHLTLPTNREV